MYYFIGGEMPNVTQKGQVTIPKKIRSLLNIKEGDEVMEQNR